MFRSSLILLNICTFLFAQISFALQPTELSLYNDFFSQTGVTKRSVLLKEIHRKYAKNLPTDVRIQMEAYLKENPNAMVPKLNVQKNGQELQISLTTNSENLILQTKPANQKQIWATLVGTKDGKPVKEEISAFALTEAAQYIYQERAKQESAKPKFLTANEYKQLNQNQKLKYIQLIRKLMEEAEAIQNFNSKSKEVSILELFMENAWALDGKCIIAGYIGNYKGTNKCKLPNGPGESYTQSNCPAGKTHCDPMIYGMDNCIGENGIVPYYATKACNENTKAINVIPPLTSIKDEESFNKILSTIKTQIKTLSEKCEKEILPSFKLKKAGKDQAKTCEDLQLRIEEINKLQCTDYEKVVTSFQCHPKPAPPTVPTAPTTLSAPAARSASAEVSQCVPQKDGSGKAGNTTNTTEACVAPKAIATAGKTATVGGNTNIGTSDTKPGATANASTGADGGNGPGDRAEKNTPTPTPATLSTVPTPTPSATGASSAGTSEAATTAVTPKTEDKAGTGKEIATEKPKEKTKATVEEESIRQKDCKALASVQGQLKCGKDTPTKALACELTENGKTEIRQLNYCVCKDAKESKWIVQTSLEYVTECSKDVPVKVTERSGRARAKDTSSELTKNIAKVLPFALGGLMIYAVHYTQKKQMDQYYQMYIDQMESINAPVTTTTTTPTTPLTPPPAGGTR